MRVDFSMTFYDCAQGFFNQAETVKIRLATMCSHHG